MEQEWKVGETRTVCLTMDCDGNPVTPASEHAPRSGLTKAPDLTAAVLKPGDRVLIAFAEQLDYREATEWASKLHGEFPGVRFSMLSNVAAVLLQRDAEDPEAQG